MSTPFDRRRSLEVGRGRIVAIQERLALHPCDQKDLSDIVEDPKALSRIMVKLVLRRNCFMTTVQRFDFGGPPRRVYCGYRVNTPSHDNTATKILGAFGYPPCERGPMVKPVGDVRPDVVTTFTKPRYWEIDLGTEGYDEIARKVESYAKQSRAVLWVCPTENRRRQLIEWTKPIHHLSFYGLIDTLIQYPKHLSWKSATGKDCYLEFQPGVEGAADQSADKSAGEAAEGVSNG